MTGDDVNEKDDSWKFVKKENIIWDIVIHKR